MYRHEISGISPSPLILTEKRSKISSVDDIDDDELSYKYKVSSFKDSHAVAKIRNEIIEKVHAAKPRLLSNDYINKVNEDNDYTYFDSYSDEEEDADTNDEYSFNILKTMEKNINQ